MKRFFATALASVLMITTLMLSGAGAARADQAARHRNTWLGAAALLAGIAIESNVAHKNRLAHAIQGYLPDGSTVYQDGHVVTPYGYSYYPSQYGQQVACSNGSCYITQQQTYNGYSPYGSYPARY